MAKALTDSSQSFDVRYETLLACITDPVVTFAQDGVIDEWNTAAERVFGFRKDEAIGASLFELVIDPGSLDRFRSVLDGVGTCEAPKRPGPPIDLTVRDKSGNYLPVEVTTTAMDRGLDQRSFISVFRGLGACAPTEDRSAERGGERRIEQVRESEQMLRSMVDGFGADVLAGLMTVEGRMLVANRALRDAGGGALDDVPGQLLPATRLFDHSAKAQGRIQEAIRRAAAGEPSRFDLQIRGGGDAGLVWVEFSVQPVHNDLGRLTYLVLSALVIQERKAAEARLRQSEEGLTITLQSIGDAVIATDVAGRITRMNAAAERMTGWSMSDASGLALGDVFRIVNAHTRARADNPVQRVMDSGEVVWLDDHTALLAHDGREYRIADSAAPIRNAFGQIEGVVLVFCDVTEKYRVEEALRSAEELFRRTFELVPHPMTLQAGDGTLLNCNDAFGEWAGAPRKQLIGRRTAELDLWANPDERVLMVEAMVRDGYVDGFEAQIRKGGGEEHTVQVSSRLMSIGDKELLLTVANDITPIKKAEKELLASQAQLSNALAIAHLGPWTYDVGKDQFTFTETFYLMHRTSAAEVGGYTMSADEYARRFVHPDARGQVAAEIRKAGEATDSGYCAEFESRIVYGDGCFGEVAVRMFVTKDADGRTTALYGVHQDITDRKQASERQRASEERHRSTIESAMDGFWSVDRTGQLLEVNAAYCRMSGYSAQELVGMKVPDLEAVETPEEVAAHFRKFEILGEDRFETRHRRKDGSIFDVEVGVQYKSADGGRLVVFLRDITERKSAERERLQLEEQLRHSQKLEAVGTLAGGIAHDFNNILSGIFGFTSLARAESEGNIEVLACLDEIGRGGRRAADLIRQILTFSQASDVDEDHIPTSLGQVLEEATHLLRAACPATIQFEVRVARDLPLVKGDGTQLHQVVMNLGTNGITAMGSDPGVLTLGLDIFDVSRTLAENLGVLSAGPHVRLTVKDTGGGMDVATRERIFEPFFSTKTIGDGTGLGLSVVHGIIQNHQGAMRVSSEMGQGSTFEVFLPAMVSRASVVAADLVPSIPRGHGECILFVDDEAGIIKMAAPMLGRLGYIAECETEVLKALERVESDPSAFQLVISDQTMPEMQGLEFARRVRALRADLPVILSSGYSAALTPEVLEAAGVREVLAKPYTRAMLATVIRKHLPTSRPPTP